MTRIWLVYKIHNTAQESVMGAFSTEEKAKAWIESREDRRTLEIESVFIDLLEANAQ